MDGIKTMFVDLWVLMKVVWASLREHHRGFTLLLLMLCFLAATILFGFWALVGLILVTILGVFLPVLMPDMSTRAAKAALYTSLTIVVLAGTYSIFVFAGLVASILVIGALVYFGFFAK